MKNQSEITPLQDSISLRKQGFSPARNLPANRSDDTMTIWEHNGVRALSTNGDPLIGDAADAVIATEWVYDQDENGSIDQAELEAAFAALYRRPADDEDREAGLWSLCCAATPNCGTRPQSLCDYTQEEETKAAEQAEQRFQARIAAEQDEVRW